MIVGEIKTEPPLDIHVSQNEPSTSHGIYIRRPSRDSAITESMSTAQLQFANDQRSDAERFGLFVAQSLTSLPNEILRRKLEIDIETVILNAKKAAFQ